MTPRYRQLIDDHEEIAAAADALLARCAGGGASAADLSGSLDRLARRVHDHVAAEDVIVARIDRAGVPKAWRSVWVDGRAAFEALRTDWLSFIARWTPAAIDRDAAGFCADAGVMLGELGERLRSESEAWYAVALHRGGTTEH